MEKEITTTQEIAALLKAQYEGITNRLAATEKEHEAVVAQYKEQRAKILSEAQPLAQALKALGVTVAPLAVPGSNSNGTGRKFVMSETAKQNIREGLKRAREKKLAAAQAATTTKTEADAQAPKAEASTPAPAAASTPAKKSAAKKGGARA